MPPLQNQNDIFLQRIPDDVYHKMETHLSTEYHFLNGSENGGRMRLSNYFVGISSQLAEEFVAFIEEVTLQIKKQEFPKIALPEGFDSQNCGESVTNYEQSGGFSFGSFDMAVTPEGLRNIEFQAIATYPITAAKLNFLLKEHIGLENVSALVGEEVDSWEELTAFYGEVFGGEQKREVVLTDRNLKQQKTNFEFYATQKELGLSVEIVDIGDIFEQEGQLFYHTNSSKPKPIHRLYNRVLPSEAIYEDNYPNNNNPYKFRFDKSYKNLKFINHPSKLFEVSKWLLPYIPHDFNPSAFELEAVARGFESGELQYKDYVWKHKVGAAGFSLILSPSLSILQQLKEENVLGDYVVQKKVHYKIFKTDDGLEKIVELRFMTAHAFDKISIVPMARIGHCVEDPASRTKTYKIHFGDNNKQGHGFAPVLICKEN